MSFKAWILGFLFFSAMFVWSSISRKKKINQAFKGRELLTSEGFYDRFFRSKGISEDVVDGVREILELHLNADLSRLHAKDDFSRNLKFFFDQDSMVDVEIVVALEKRFQIKITDSEAEQTHTVEDIVQLVSAKLAS